MTRSGEEERNVRKFHNVPFFEKFTFVGWNLSHPLFHPYFHFLLSILPIFPSPQRSRHLHFIIITTHIAHTLAFPPSPRLTMMSWRSCLSRLFSPNNSSTKRTRLYCTAAPASTHTRQREKRNKINTSGITASPTSNTRYSSYSIFFNNGRSINLLAQMDLVSGPDTTRDVTWKCYIDVCYYCFWHFQQCGHNELREHPKGRTYFHWDIDFLFSSLTSTAASSSFSHF
jgi:hypothetical protein